MCPLYDYRTCPFFKFWFKKFFRLRNAEDAEDEDEAPTADQPAWENRTKRIWKTGFKIRPEPVCSQYKTPSWNIIRDNISNTGHYGQVYD